MADGLKPGVLYSVRGLYSKRGEPDSDGWIVAVKVPSVPSGPPENKPAPEAVEDDVERKTGE